MILQALNDYYARRQRLPDPAERLPQTGLEGKEVPFILELAGDGRLIAMADTRQVQGKKWVAKRYQVPQGVKKTSGVAANLLWDTVEYVLGHPDEKKLEAARLKDQEGDYLGRLQAMQAAFRERVDGLLKEVPDDAGLLAVQRFLLATPLAAAQAQVNWADLAAAANPVVSFRLSGDLELVCQRPDVILAINHAPPDAEPSSGVTCLVTGNRAEPERLHSAIKGVWGAQTSGANIVSFNLDAFASYGKLQGANAPVSPAAVFAYTTALNSLLARDSRQRMQVGDASTVFWAQSDEDRDMEVGFAALFSDNADDPDAHADQVRALFDALRTGRFDGGAGERRFHVLGLAPNAARISIRFWQSAPLRELARHIRRWFADLSLVRGPNDPEHPSLFRLLTSVALVGKIDNLQPSLGGDVMRAILTGCPYPATLLQAAVIRCRAERHVPYLRAAVIKACLLRAQASSTKEEPTVMLNTDNPHVAYRLGRLFATLEKIQEEASPGLNATIRDRYYGAASSTPVVVFTTLLRLKNHHLAKLTNKGRATNFEKLLADIVSAIGEIPSHLNLPDQGRFALGYYHQRQAFFTRAVVDDTSAPDVGAADAPSPVQPSLI